MVKGQNADLFIAGPAFNAGRYGVACGTVCDMIKEELGIPVVTGMYVENPGADMFKDKVYIVPTKNSAAGMRDAIGKLAPLAMKLAKGEIDWCFLRRQLHAKRYPCKLIRGETWIKTCC